MLRTQAEKNISPHIASDKYNFLRGYPTVGFPIHRVRSNNSYSVAEHEKISDYLLDPAHPDNGGKAEFFRKLGFRRNEWEALASALRTLAETADVAGSMESPHGRKYAIVGRIESPEGKAATLQTIWIVDKGLDGARFVTAYPRKDREA